jgi:hypothetical protein
MECNCAAKKKKPRTLFQRVIPNACLEPGSINSTQLQLQLQQKFFALLTHFFGGVLYFGFNFLGLLHYTLGFNLDTI